MRSIEPELEPVVDARTYRRFCLQSQRRYLPGGTPDIEVTLPFNNPAKLVFGSEDMQSLFNRSMSESLGSTNPTPLDGGVFSFKPGTAGKPEPLFAS